MTRVKRLLGLGFNIQLELLPQATGSISNANLSPLMTLVAKHMKFQGMMMLPLEMRKVAHGNTLILSPKLHH